MISFGIIVFREVLEVSLVLGIVLAGTKQVAGRGPWIFGGLLAGLMGSIVVALFTETISSALEGVGQEVFNASVLLLAALLIAFTVVWMKGHAKKLTAQLREVSHQVQTGVKPLSVLSVVIGLAVLREGSEIVLLGYGVLAAGVESKLSLGFGAFLGLCIGGLIGWGIYKGLVRTATGLIFEVTTWLLIVLSAGMVSQAIGLLAAADLVPLLATPVWDTSSLLSEHSLIGQSLSVMIGYCSRPSGMQVLCYILTIVTVWVALKFASSAGLRRSQHVAAAIVAAVTLHLLLAGATPNALAIDKVYSPIVEEGELEFETKGTYSFDNDNEVDGAYAQYFGVGYGFTDRFFAELYGEIGKEPPESTEFEAVVLETRYQLFDQGEYWLDSGLYLEYKYETEEEEHELEGKLLLEKSTQSWVHTANLVLERKVFTGESEDLEGALRWSTRYRFSPSLEPGVELHSELHELDEWSGLNDKEHAAGPAVYGSIGGGVGYQFAVLLGLNDEAPDTTLRWTLEIEL